MATSETWTEVEGTCSLRARESPGPGGRCWEWVMACVVSQRQARVSAISQIEEL